MKKVLIGLGVIISLGSVISLSQYFFDYKALSDYGKGFVWGKLFLLAVGVLFIILGMRRKQSAEKPTP